MPQPEDPNLKVDSYHKLYRDKSIKGQAHHINQNKAFETVIPRDKAVSVKLEGNVRINEYAPHTMAHKELEQFWQTYRTNSELPTNIRYTVAARRSLIASGISKENANIIIRHSIRQRLDYGLLGGEKVPRVPGKMYLKGGS